MALEKKNQWLVLTNTHRLIKTELPKLGQSAANALQSARRPAFPLFFLAPDLLDPRIAAAGGAVVAVT